MNLPKRQKLKAAVQVTQPKPVVHDRRAIDRPFNSRIAVEIVDDPMGVREFASLAVAEHTRDVSRPGNHRATELRSPGQPKISVIVSMRSDPIRTLKHLGHISELQFMAGDRYRTDIDTSMISGGRAIDPTKEAVDGGNLYDPLTERVEAALSRLRKAERALGPNGRQCCRAVLGEGIPVSEFSRRIGLTTKHGMSTSMHLLRVCLDVLTEEYGLAVRTVLAQHLERKRRSILGLDKIGERV